MKILKTFFAITLFGFIANAQNSTPNPPGHAYGLYHHFSELTPADITLFLERTDHVVLTTPITEDAGRTWTCYTRKSDGNTYFTVVYTDGENVLGYEDTAIG
jgi:hypothetical protein